MSVRQFINSLSIIRRSEHVNRATALRRHLSWQFRKLAFRPVELRLSGSLIADDEPSGIISLVNMLGTYDFNNMNFVQLVVARALNFLDVGANIGAYTLIGSEVPMSRVVSLEPSVAAFTKLMGNVARNRRDNVTALNLAASKVAGTLRMTNYGASPINRIVDSDTPSEDTVAVPVETVDAICHRLGFVPSLIKIDVEGHEPEVLAGATYCLQTVLGCLVENGGRHSIVAIMRRAGLTGPLYYHHRCRHLRWCAQRLPEDQIFIGPRFAQEFPEIAIELPASKAHGAGGDHGKVNAAAFPIIASTGSQT